MKKRLNFVLVSLAMLLLGVMLTAAFAPYDVYPLAIVAPALLLASILKVSPKRAFWLGLLFGWGFFGSGVYWVFNSIHDIGQVSTWLSLLVTGGMITILSLYPAFVCYALNRYFPINNVSKISCAFPAIWVFSEWLRSILFTGFPWLLLGYSQSHSPLKGYAPIFSVYGVSLAVLVTGGLFLNAVFQYREKNYRGIYQSIVIAIAIWLAGSLLSLIPWTKPTGKPLSMSLVQGNIAQTIKWSPEHLQTSLDRYQDLSEPLWGKDKIIIWPEAAVPLTLQDAKPYIDAMAEKAKAHGAYLILGIPIYVENKGYYNSIVVLNAKDQSIYHKRQLVPFGEYTPLSAWFANLLQLMKLPLADNTVPGNFHQAPLKIGDVKILPSICYEIAYPELILTRDPSINLILTVTNDAWFGKSNAEAQHLQMAEMRAIELGRPVVFVSNDGITAFITPQGRIESAAPQFEATTLSGEVQPMYGITPWMQNGMDPILFILICLLAFSLRAKFKMQKEQASKILMKPEQ